MQFSPFVLAALTASAALGIAHPAKAQVTDSMGSSGETSSGAVSSLENGDASEPWVESADGEAADGGEPALAEPELGPEWAADAAAPEDGAWTGEALDESAPVLEVNFGLDSLPDPELPLDQLSQAAPAEDAGSNEAESGAEVEEFQLDPDTAEFEFGAPQTTEQQFDFQPEASDAPAATEQAVPDPSDPNLSNPVRPDQPPSFTPPAPAVTQPEPRVLVAEVLVDGAEGELLDEVYRVIRTQPGRTTTRSQLQEDINAIFATGFFSNVQAVPSDTPLGVRVTFVVQGNPVLKGVELRGTEPPPADPVDPADPADPEARTTVIEFLEYEGEVLPTQEVVERIFSPQYNQTANLRGLQAGIERLNQVYKDNGYSLAQVISAPEISPDGIAQLTVAEGIIEDIEIRFLNKDGEAVDEDGEPIRGRTRPFIITREFESEQGQVFNETQIQRDLQRAFGLGIFEDLNIALNPGQDPSKVDVIVNVTERRTGSIAASVGVSSVSGLFGAVSLQEQNLGGNNQRVNAEVQLGQRDILFDLSFTDPWIATDPNRTSYTVNAFGRQSISLIFDGGEEDIDLPNGDRPRVRRFGGGVSFSRPLDDAWRASLGLQYQNISIRDADGTLSPRDEFGNLLSYNRSGIDNVATLQFAASQDLRNDPTRPTAGSVLRFSTEQALGIGSLFYNRMRANYTYYIPVRLLRFTAGCQQDDPTPEECPQTLVFNAQGGTILGDFPPYEAFAMGGTDSVRGYDAGELGSGQSYLQGTVEYRFPVFSIVSGAVFLDAGTDLGTGDDVQGDPAGIREKPGSGFGYGIGVRVQSPVGQIRVDYAINDDGENRIHFGIGERF